MVLEILTCTSFSPRGQALTCMTRLGAKKTSALKVNHERVCDREGGGGEGLRLMEIAKEVESEEIEAGTGMRRDREI